MTLLEKNWPLSVRALFICLLLALFASLIIGLPITRSAVEHLEQQQSQLRQTLTKQVSLQSAEAIFSQDLLSLNVILAAITEDRSVHYAAVYNLNNELMAEQGSTNDTQSQPISIQHQNEVIGLLEIQLDDTTIAQRTWQLYGLWIVVSLFFVILSSLIGWLIGRTLGRKLQVSQYELEHLGAIKQITEHQSGEFNDLSKALKKLHDTTTLQKVTHHALSRYMQPQLTPSWQHRQLVIETDYTQGAVLFFKLANLDQAQQELDKTELASLLEHHYSVIQQAAKLYNGCVTHYEHNGIMVLFDQEQNDDKHSFHGICTGLLVLGLLKQLNEDRSKQGLHNVDFQLALHCGDILTRRFPNTAQVDTKPWLAMNNDKEACHGAALLCEQSEANALLVSKSAIESGQLAGQLSMQKHHNLIQLNGSEPVVSYWIEAFIPNYQALIERQVEHLAHNYPKQIR
ncbi:hypothetical protein NBRC116188_15320 [Oceaniserpentilla sp. 4NH20-0058]|uniref:hypothetical protein n=1 Tax=Oceaniserpentilla sp. 4NH20-0058 TaxID=3127660 RepID=UPI00310A2751